jgi:hypothetical protein
MGKYSVLSFLLLLVTEIFIVLEFKYTYKCESVVWMIFLAYLVELCFLVMLSVLVFNSKA